MGEFVDQYMPANVPGYPCIAIPRFSTNMQVNSGGHEKRTRLWADPKYVFTLPDAPGRDWAVVEALKNHWLGLGGPHQSWPFRDPTDFASVPLDRPNVVPTISFTDQVLGSGDGINERFYLKKAYTSGLLSYTRDIHLPVLNTVVVGVDGVLVDSADYTVDRPGGEIVFDTPPGDGLVVTAGFLFDNEVRFEDDDVMETVYRSFETGGFANITLVETRNC